MPNKWTVPAWCVPGTPVLIARGRKRPGTKGTVVDTSTTGNGAVAYVRPEGVSDPDPIHWLRIWVLNLDKV